MAEHTMPDPVVHVTDIQELARDLVVIPNRQVQLVPNIGIIGGRDSVLVVETGMGPGNAEKVLEFAAGYAKGRRLFLTTTHFHPEHAFGAQTFAGEATFLINQAQAEDLKVKGPGYIDMFKGLGEPVARQLEESRSHSPMSSTSSRTTWTWEAGSCGYGPQAGRTARATRWSGCRMRASCSRGTSRRPVSSPSSRGSRRTTPTSRAPAG